MIGQITEIDDFGYEIHKNGHFWKTYIYKKDSKSNYLLINIIRTLTKPYPEQILENIELPVPISEMCMHSGITTTRMAK